MDDPEMADAQKRKRGLGVRVSPEINFGQILIVLSLLGSVSVVYADMKATLAVHEQRLASLERSREDERKENRIAIDGIHSKLEDISKAMFKKGMLQ